MPYCSLDHAAKAAPLLFSTLGIASSAAGLAQALNVMMTLGSILFVAALALDILQIALSTQRLIKKYEEKPKRQKLPVNEVLDVISHSMCFIATLTAIFVALVTGVTLLSLMPIVMPIIFALKSATLFAKVLKDWMSFFKGHKKKGSGLSATEKKYLIHLIIKTISLVALVGVTVGIALLQISPVTLLVSATFSLLMMIIHISFEQLTHTAKQESKKADHPMRLFTPARNVRKAHQQVTPPKSHREQQHQTPPGAQQAFGLT